MSLRQFGRVLSVVCVLALAFTAYVASPFVAAWQLREAIKSNDVETIRRKVEWEPVRASLKSSLSRHAELLPQATAAGESVKPSMWQRVKSAFGATMLDRFIEAYVTPEGLPQLFSYRKAWRETVKGEPDEAGTKPWHERLTAFVQRIKRAEFQGFTRVVLEVQDRNTEDRRYRSVFELTGFEWKLTQLEVLGTGAGPGPLPEQPKLRDLAGAAWSIAKGAARPN